MGNKIQKEDKTALTLDIDGEICHFGTISIRRATNELFYIFPFAQKRGFVKFVDYSKPIPEKRTERYPDHISFHRDGKVHLRYKNIKGTGKTRNDIKFNKSPFSLSDNQYAPLLFHTVYGVGSNCFPTFTGMERYNRECTIDSKTGVITVVLFVVGKNIVEENMLATHFPNAFEIPVILGNLWICDKLLGSNSIVPETRLLVAISHKTLVMPQKNLLFSFGITPPDNIINGLGRENRQVT